MRMLSRKLVEAIGGRKPKERLVQHKGRRWFTFPAELKKWEKDLGDQIGDVEWRVDVDYGEDGDFSDSPMFSFYRGNIYYGSGELGFKKGGVGGFHGPSHPSLAVWGPYIRPAWFDKGVYRVPRDVEAYAIKLADRLKLIDAPSGTFIHPRRRRRRPRSR